MMKRRTRRSSGSRIALLAVLGSVLAAGALIMFTGGASGDAPGTKVTICHSTSSATNPYVSITIAPVAVVEAHINHHHNRDIIPPFTYKDHSYSQNWDAAGQAIFNNDCMVVRTTNSTSETTGTTETAAPTSETTGTTETAAPTSETTGTTETAAPTSETTGTTETGSAISDSSSTGPTMETVTVIIAGHGGQTTQFPLPAGGDAGHSGSGSLALPIIGSLMGLLTIATGLMIRIRQRRKPVLPGRVH